MQQKTFYILGIYSKAAYTSVTANISSFLFCSSAYSVYFTLFIPVYFRNSVIVNLDFLTKYNRFFSMNVTVFVYVENFNLRWSR